MLIFIIIQGLMAFISQLGHGIWPARGIFLRFPKADSFQLALAMWDDPFGGTGIIRTCRHFQFWLYPVDKVIYYSQC